MNFYFLTFICNNLKKLSQNPNLPCSLDFFEKYLSKWDFNILLFNNRFYKIFESILDVTLVNEILDEAYNLQLNKKQIKMEVMVRFMFDDNSDMLEKGGLDINKFDQFEEIKFGGDGLGEEYANCYDVGHKLKFKQSNYEHKITKILTQNSRKEILRHNC